MDSTKNSSVSDQSLLCIAAGYVDIDCGLREGDVPSVVEILESPACCYMDCDDDDDDDDDSCPAAAVRCSQVGLISSNATYNATCRFALSTVTPTALLEQGV